MSVAGTQGHQTEVPFSWFGVTLRRFIPYYGELLVLAACLRLIGLIEPFIFQVIIDRILPFQREASLVVVVVIFCAASLFQIGFDVLAQLLGQVTANRVIRELGDRIYAHTFSLPFRHFRRWSAGEIIARIGETGVIHDFLVSATTGVFLDIVFVAVYLCVLLALSVPLTLIILAALPLQILIYSGFGPFLRRRLTVQFDAGAAHQTQMVESIAGIAAAKALSAETVLVTRLNVTLSGALQSGYSTAVLNLWRQKLLFGIDRVVTISIVFVGAQLVFASKLTLGELVSFHLLSGTVIAPIEGFFPSMGEMAKH